MCTPCPAGTYSSSITGTGSTDCLSCPIGTYNPTMGASSSDDCLTCGTGTESLAGSTACSFAISTIAGVSGLVGSTGDGGSGVSALLSNLPYGFTADLTGKYGYIADNSNNKIRVLDLTVGTISTLTTSLPANYAAGGTSTSLPAVMYPSAVAIGGSGKVLFVIDYNNHIVRKIVLSTGIMSRYVGYNAAGCTTGSTTLGNAFGLNYPRGVVVDSSDNLYIADTGNHRVVMTMNSTTMTSTVAGQTLAVTGGNSGSTGDGGPATSARLNTPYGVALDWYGLLYIADTGNCRVRLVNSGTITTVAGLASQGVCGYAGDGGPATSAVLNQVASLAFSPTNDMYIADYNSYCVRVVKASTSIITTFAGNCGVSQGATGDGPVTYARFSNIYDITFDVLGNLYVTDTGNHIIRKISMPAPTTYIHNTVAPTAAPVRTFPSVMVITTIAGSYQDIAGNIGDGEPATSAQLNNPNGVATDSYGTLYIADNKNHKIRMVNSAGIITTFAGTGTYGSLGDGGMATSAQLWLPTAVGPDIFGNVYIADYRNMKIRLVNSAGTITTIAGTGTDGSTGDGGPATSAQLNYPSGVVADLYGNIYIADYQNKKIRMVTSAGSKHTLLNTIYILTNL